MVYLLIGKEHDHELGESCRKVTTPLKSLHSESCFRFLSENVSQSQSWKFLKRRNAKVFFRQNL